MTLDEAIKAVNARPLSEFVEIIKARNGGYICPICGSGSGASGTGGFSVTPDGRRYRCFACDAFSSGDHETQDTLGALRVIWQCDTAEAVRRAGYDAHGYSAAHEARALSDQPERVGSLPTREEEPRRNFSEYFTRCRAELDRNGAEAVAYLARRGISKATAAAFGAGYDAKADTAESGHICKRLIFPAGVGCYVGRSIEQNTPKPFQKLTPKGARVEMSGLDALDSGAGVVFVTEGIFDAMSIHEAGARAISLNSASNARKLSERLRQRGTSAAVLVMLDNDEAGQNAQQRLLDELKSAGIRCAAVNVCGQHKDANEALQADRAAFVEAVRRELVRAAFSLPTREEAAGDQSGGEFETVAGYISGGGFSADVLETSRAGELVTGFRQLDAALNGWTPGLHVLGGAPGTGKTAFAGQLADGIAESGRDVVYYSLEMPRAVMTARALARTALQRSGARYVGEDAAALHFSALDLLRGRCDADQLGRLTADYLRRVGDRLTITDQRLTLDAIRDHARRRCQRTGRAPVLVVDYLQILGLLSAAEQSDAKRYTDEVVTGLVDLAKELKTHIFAISSLARAGYSKDADYSALKESGLIEYGANTVLMLQLRLIYTKVKVSKHIKKTDEIQTSYREPTTAELDAEKQKSPRKLDLSILKSRSGGVGQHIALNYYSRCDQFDEIDTDSAAAELAAAAEGGADGWTDAATV